MLCACATVDIGGPHTSQRNPQAGILQLEDGKQIAVLPTELRYTGQATYTWPDGQQQSGMWVDGLLQGMGTETTSSEHYSGQWLDGMRHGHGELEQDDGTRYVGDFRNGLAEGKGTQTAKAGVYQGTWLAGRRHGQGQFNDANGAIYQGGWAQGQRSGFGRQQFASGGIYEGDWLADKPAGFGRFLFATGALYEGAWVAGVRTGYGTWSTPAKLSYEGTWFNDKRHGFGIEHRPDGSYFSGQWQADLRQGNGQEVHPDGSRHVGIWQADEIAGLGQRTNRAGIVIEGDWLGDNITRGSVTLPSAARYNGELFKADGRAIAPELLAWMSTRASADDPHAQYFLASIYSDFAEPEPKPQIARIWFTRAAEAGVAEAQFRLAAMSLEDDINGALRWLNKAAAQNHPRANELLGEYFHTGTYMQKDLSAAIRHYENAAEKGSVAATNNLAWLLATTKDTQTSDPERAIELIRPFVLYMGNWQHLDTLAAAHARLGETEKAQRMQNQALIQARSIAPEAVIDEMSLRLDLYADKQAYTE
jgi:hypothetical protein